MTLFRSPVDNHQGMENDDGNLGQHSDDVSHSSLHKYLTLGYYQRPFALLHSDPAFSALKGHLYHPVRQSFWQLIEPGEYTGQLAREYLESYIATLESYLRQNIAGLSLAYFVHLYRRLSPEPIGNNDQPMTIGRTRAILEAAIQKYAAFQFCDKVAWSTEVSIDKVLGGLLMSPEFENERCHCHGVR